MKFRVGDIVTGKKSADIHYCYTTSKATMKVVGIYAHKIDVCILSHETTKKCVGRTYLVNPGRFILVKSRATNYIKEE